MASLIFMGVSYAQPWRTFYWTTCSGVFRLTFAFLVSLQSDSFQAILSSWDLQIKQGLEMILVARSFWWPAHFWPKKLESLWMGKGLFQKFTSGNCIEFVWSLVYFLCDTTDGFWMSRKVLLSGKWLVIKDITGKTADFRTRKADKAAFED